MYYEHEEFGEGFKVRYNHLCSKKFKFFPCRQEAAMHNTYTNIVNIQLLQLVQL